VAEFIGTCNALDGEIVAVRAGQDVFQTGPGLQVPLPHRPERIPGQQGRLLIRPERLRLSQCAPEGGGWRGTVEQRTYFGTHVRYVVTVEGRRLNIYDARFDEGEYGPGAELWVTPPRTAVFLPGDEDRRGEQACAA
jgi:ABC-type Fe3+/spermidine/putrescine transport system ATPase subunit